MFLFNTLYRYIYYLSKKFAINCDPSKYYQQGHGGYLANDGIDDMKVNVKYEMVLNKEPFWDSLSKTDKVEAAKLYGINPDSDLLT